MNIEAKSNGQVCFSVNNTYHIIVQIDNYKELPLYEYTDIKYIHNDEQNYAYITSYMNTALRLNSRYLIDGNGKDYYIKALEWDKIYISPTKITEKELYSTLNDTFCLYCNWKKICKTFYKHIDKHILPPINSHTELEYTVDWNKYDPIIMNNNIFISGELFDYCYRLVAEKQFIQMVMPISSSFRIVFRPVSGIQSKFTTEHITAGITSIILQIENYMNINVLEKKLIGALNYTFNDIFIDRLLYYKCVEYFIINYFYMINMRILNISKKSTIILDYKCTNMWIIKSLEKKLYELGLQLPIWEYEHIIDVNTLYLLIKFGVQYDKTLIIEQVKNTTPLNINLLNIISYETVTLNNNIIDTSIHFNILTDCVLRKYQIYACHWIMNHIKNERGCILADDMGLGKTVVILALIKYYILNAQWRFLLVLPASLLLQWENEIVTKTGLTCCIIDSAKNYYVSCSIGLISYNRLRTIKESVGLLNDKPHYNCIIIDEAHVIKNKKSKIFSAISSVPIRHRIAITATPIENKVDDIWTLFEFIMPGFLGKENIFSKYYTQNIACKTLIKTYILRRTKQELLPELPLKIIQDCKIPLTQYQKDLYNNVILSASNCKNDNISCPFSMKVITQLKQICNHVSLYDNTNLNCKDKSQSAKWNRLYDLLDTIFKASDDSKIIIFTQYVQMGQILVQLIEYYFNTKPLFFHGQNSKKANTNMIEFFQTNFDIRIMIVSLKAGGCGLNLTAANYIVHYDLWWNPSIEDQASDRAHRIGQNKVVNVYRFITPQSIEENINSIIYDKKDIIEQTLNITK